VRIDPQDFERYYASLSDEGLRSIDRDQLTGQAQERYDAEVALRGIDLTAPEDGEPLEIDEEPDWLPDAAVALSYTAYPGSTSASDAATARAVLREAGIPCHISINELEPGPPSGEPPPQRLEYQLMVPGALNLQAASVLDVEIFNADVEAEWAAHFQALTDGELAALSPEVICAGWEDRIVRLKRAYAAEMVRRGFAEEEPAE
jgi:hypothetical protein